MPVHRPSRPIATTSNSRKSMGFSINDIIKNDDSAKISTRDIPPPMQSYIPATSWIPPPSSLDPIVQYQLQCLRHSGRLFDGRFTSPEAAAALILHSFRKPKRVRTAFTPAQLLKLENAFEKNHYVVGQERKELARHLNLTETQVKVWYQNRRTKHKRLKSEDGNNSSNDINDDEEQQEESIEHDHDHNQQNQSDTSDIMNKNDDEHSWDNNNPHYQFISQSSTPRSSVSDRYYLHLAAAAAAAAKNGSSDDHR
ncbi:unnamed protein product [Adineta steineri]|uniref:Homeobox domain-containing protein n=2 Tax=Adineta steineri TaxID=433720 RepID=A0A819APN7_9BILA|nr:unnamed protein product [Adineta steineri]CAF1487975.1 unnamed protein product [Adineta steineri]CAF3502951.1 unnamed protein product [Adineta steineri]CAF3789083.1 unnamed protein product [Adineta steineri]